MQRLSPPSKQSVVDLIAENEAGFSITGQGYWASVNMAFVPAGGEIKVFGETYSPD